MCWCGFNALRQDVLDRHRRLACPGVTVGVTTPARVTRQVTAPVRVTEEVTPREHQCSECGELHKRKLTPAEKQAAYRARQGQ